MTRPHLLTRVKGHDLCEYTRFRAEANAVLVRPNGGITSALAYPFRAEYVTEAEPEPAVTLDESQTKLKPATDMSMSEAIDAIRSDEFDKAIPFFKKLTEERPNYHIGWLRLGYAMREKAVRIADEDETSAESLLKDSLEALTEASRHVDREYQAQALYERSKSGYHFKRLFPNVNGVSIDYLADAKAACDKSNEKKFLTWLDHVQTWSPSGAPIPT